MFLELWQVFLDPHNLFFSTCLTICLFITVLELAGLLIGGSNSWADNLLPDFLKNDIHIDHVDGASGVFTTLSSWIYLGRTPFLIWLIIFIGGWGGTGLILQSLAADFFGHPLISIIAIPLAFFINLFVVHYTCAVINPILPKDETTAINLNELIGFEAEIVIGTAKLNFPAEAKVKDQHGATHYIMVVPENDSEYQQGQKVIISERIGGSDFKVIAKNELNNTIKHKS